MIVGMAGSNPADSMKTCLMNIVSCRFCDDSSSRRNQPCMCVVGVVCVCNSNPLHVQTVRKKGKKEERCFNFIKLFILSTVFFVLCLLVTFKQFLDLAFRG